jgi:glutathione S-transferase
MFTLYNAPQSTCSQRVRFVLNAKRLAFTEVKLDLLAGDQLKPDYLKLNPNGVVPTLDHDGKIVIDSAVIGEYLDEIAPEPESFTPQTPLARAHMRALTHFIDEMPAAAIRVPTFNLAFLPRFAAMSEQEFVAFAESKPLRKEFMLAMGRQGFSAAEMQAALDRLGRTLTRMDAEIEKTGGPWLLGAREPRRHLRDARNRAHGRSRARHDVARQAARRALARGNPRPSGVQAHLLFRLAPDREVPAFEGAGGGAGLTYCAGLFRS